MDEVDEFGIPIKKTATKKQAVDEFGIPIKKKGSSEPTSQEKAGGSPTRPTQPSTSSDTEPPTRAQASVALGGPTSSPFQSIDAFGGKGAVGAIVSEQQKTQQPSESYAVQVFKKAKSEVDENITEERLLEEKNQSGILNNLGKAAKSIWNVTGAGLSSINEALGGTKDYFTIDEYKPLQEEKIQAKKELEKEGLPITGDNIQKRAEDIFRINDKRKQLEKRIDANLPEDYDRQGIWKELKLDNLKKNSSLKEAVISADIYKGQINEFEKYYNSLKNIPREQITQAQVDKYNELLGNANESLEGLKYLDQKFPKILEEVKSSDELLDVFKYNYNDYEKHLSNIKNFAKGIAGGTVKLMEETARYLDEKTGLDTDVYGFREGNIKMANEVLDEASEDREQFIKYKAKDISNFSDVGSFMAGLGTEQLPVFVTLAIAPELGPALLGAGTGGEQFRTMEIEESQPFAKKTSFGQKLATSYMYGGAEALFERLGTVSVLKNIEKSIAKASNPSRKLIEDGAMQEVSRLGKQFGYNFGLEGGTEYLTAEAQIAADRYIAGKEISTQQANERRFESFVAGGLMGGGMTMIGGVWGGIAQKARIYSDNKDIKKTKEILSQIERLSDEVKNNPNLTPEERVISYKKMNELTNQSFDIVSKNAKKGKDFNAQETQFLVDINVKQAELKAKLQEIKDSNFSKEQKETFINELKDEYSKLEEKRNTTLQGGYNKLTELPSAEVIRLKDKAARELMKELNPDGTKTITINDSEITKRAIQLLESETKAPAVEVVAPKVIAEEKVKTETAAVEAKPITSGQRVSDVLNRPATLESFGGAKLDAPVEGNIYQEGQRVIFEDKNNKTYDLGNVDEISDTKVEDLGIQPQTELMSVTPEGKIKVGDNTWNIQTELPNNGVEYDTDGNVKAVSLKDDSGKTVMYEGQIAEDIAYQTLLNQTQTEEQRQAINEILENDEELNRQLREAEEATAETTGEVVEPSVAEVKAEAKPIELATEEIAPSEIETTLDEVITPASSNIKEQIARAKKALSKLLPNVEIVYHETAESFFNTVGRNDRGFYNMNKDSRGKNIIHINGSNATNTTVAHEVFHAVLLNYILDGKPATRITNRMLKAVAKSLASRPDVMDKINTFVEEGYSDEKEIWAEEKLSEVLGYLASEYETLPDVSKNIIQKWLEKIAVMLKMKPFTDKQVLDFMNAIATKVAYGQEITEGDVGKVLGKNKILEENTLSGKRKRRQAEDLFLTDTKPKLSSTKDVANFLDIWANENKLFDKDIKDVSDDVVVKEFVNHISAELNAWSKVQGDKYVSFYDEDIAKKANPTLQKYAKENYGRELKDEEVKLFHLVSAFASPSANPYMDSWKGFYIFNRYMKTGELSGYSDKMATVWETLPNKKRVDIGIPKLDSKGNPIRSKVTPAYSQTGIEKFQAILDKNNGDLKKAMDWMTSKHSFKDISDMFGYPLSGPKATKENEYLSKEDGGIGVFGMTGAKLGSYILNRFGNFSTVTKDMWYARTMARLSGEKLVGIDKETGKESAIKTPWAESTKEGKRKRELADKAFKIVANNLGTSPAMVQERIWDFEKRLYEMLGANEDAAYVSDGLNKGIEIANEEAKETSKDKVKGRKQISPENSSNYANMTEDGKGNFVFYHFGPRGIKAIDPKKYGSNKGAITSKPEIAAMGRVGGMSQFYTMPEYQESNVSGDKYMIKVPMDKVYDFNTDPDNLYDKAKEMFKAKHPDLPFTANDQLAYITKLAEKAGYDMTVAEWNDMSRAQSTKALKPVDTQVMDGNVISKPFQEDYESNSTKGFEPVIPTSKEAKLKDVYQKINAERNSKNRYDSLYSLAEDFPKLSQDKITDMIESSDISQEMKDAYAEALAYEPGARMSGRRQKEKILNIYPELKDTKAIDNTGAPLLVYHGGIKFDDFNPSQNKNDKGIYFTENKDFAEFFAHQAEVFERDKRGDDYSDIPEELLSTGDPFPEKYFKYAKIHSAYLDMKNPTIVDAIDAKDIPKNYEPNTDGFIAKSTGDFGYKGGQYVVFDPKQIKKAEAINIEGRKQVDAKAIAKNTKAEVERVKALPINAEDGATFNLDGTKYEGGGLVVPLNSIEGNTTQEKLSPEMIGDFAKENEDSVGDETMVKLGIYKFPKKVDVSVDMNIVIPREHREVALEFGAIIGQESLFDLDTFENVKTGGDGLNPMKLTAEQFREAASSLKNGVMPKFVSGRRQKSPIDTAVETAKRKGFNDKEIADYLVGKGYTREQATNAILRYNKVTAEKLRKEDSVFTKEGRNKIVTFLDQVKRRALSAKSFLPKSVFILKEGIEANIKAEAKRASYLVDDFNKLVKGYKGDLNALNDEFDRYLRGDQTAVLPDEFKAVAGKMRMHIDNLSQMLLRTGAVTVSQAETIAANLGQYINRSYQVFDKKNWAKQVTEEMKEAARVDLRNMYRASAEAKAKQTGMDADIILEKFINDKIDELISGESAATFLGIGKTGSKDLSIMKQRLDIPLSIRQLMGEYTDASQNYARTVIKIATLAENARFLQSARDAGMGVFFFKEGDINKPSEFNVQIAGEGSETMNPLNGLFTTKEIADAFKTSISAEKFIEGFVGPNVASSVVSLYTNYMKLLSVVKWNKTIASVATHFKNVTGNIWFMLSNGYFNYKKYGEAFNVLRNSSNEQLRDKLDEYIRAGIIDQSAALGEIKSMFSDADFDTAIENRLKKNPLEKAKKAARWVITKLNTAYQLEDDFYKIVSYESEKDRYSNAEFQKPFDQLTEDQKIMVSNIAAENTKNVLPNYARIPGLVKLIKIAPVTGTFISFQAEAYRTAWNTVALAFDELSSSNKKIKAIGAKRLAGIAFSQSVKFGLMTAIGTVLRGGDDDDEEDKLNKNVREFVPEWSKKSDLALVEYGNGKFSYVDFSASDPHGGIKKAYNSFMAGDGAVESFTNGMSEILGPFVKKDMLLEAITDINNNENSYGGKLYNDADTNVNKINAVAERFYKVLEPGSLTSARKIAQAENVGNELAGQLTGYKVITIDVGQQLGFKMNKSKDDIREAKRLYNSAFYKFEDGKMTAEELESNYNQANSAQKEMYKSIMDNMKAASFFGVEDRVIDDAMEGIGKGVVNDLWYGEIPDMKQKQVKLTDAEFRAKYGEKIYNQMLRGRESLKKGAK